jgi:hypothetical protein
LVWDDIGKPKKLFKDSAYEKLPSSLVKTGVQG